MRSICVHNTTVQYSVAGNEDKQPLVLLHGTNSDGQTGFGAAISKLAENYKVIVPDYAGCGASTIPDGELKLELLVDQVIAVIREASPDRPVALAGVSLGAMVAASLAARFPELVQRLILIGGWVSSGDPRHKMVFDTWAKLESLDPSLSLRYGLSLVFSPTFLTALGHERLSQFLLRQFPKNIQERIDLGRRIDLSNDLPHIKVPTLVVGMTNDFLVPSYQAHALHQAIQNSEYVEIESGHAVFIEQPDLLIKYIKQFVGEQIAEPSVKRKANLM